MFEPSGSSSAARGHRRSLPVWSWWLLGACITGPAGMAAGILALKYAEASALAPYQYVRLVFAGFAGLFVFHEPLGIMTIIGAMLIVVACIVNE
jgi:drug/metabolite transporter (DMT)-like permease